MSNCLLQTQDRMLKSAENFMAGFFGLEWYDCLLPPPCSLNLLT